MTAQVYSKETVREYLAAREAVEAQSREDYLDDDGPVNRRTAAEEAMSAEGWLNNETLEELQEMAK